MESRCLTRGLTRGVSEANSKYSWWLNDFFEVKKPVHEQKFEEFNFEIKEQHFRVPKVKPQYSLPKEKLNIYKFQRKVEPLLSPFKPNLTFHRKRHIFIPSPKSTQEPLALKIQHCQIHKQQIQQREINKYKLELARKDLQSRQAKQKIRDLKDSQVQRKLRLKYWLTTFVMICALLKLKKKKVKPPSKSRRPSSKSVHPTKSRRPSLKPKSRRPSFSKAKSLTSFIITIQAWIRFKLFLFKKREAAKKVFICLLQWKHASKSLVPMRVFSRKVRTIQRFTRNVFRNIGQALQAVTAKFREIEFSLIRKEVEEGDSVWGETLASDLLENSNQARREFLLHELRFLRRQHFPAVKRHALLFKRYLEEVRLYREQREAYRLLGLDVGSLTVPEMPGYVSYVPKELGEMVRRFMRNPKDWRN